jgi:hypothetical protein
MYDVIRSAIAAGGYKLADMQYKIKKLYVMGDLTETEMEQLLEMASGGVSADAERPEVMAMIHTLDEKISALDARVQALEGQPDEPDVPEGEYPAWKPWDGISNDYQPGAIVTHKGKVWISTFNGQNVWEPGTVGEQFWKEYAG